MDPRRARSRRLAREEALQLAARSYAFDYFDYFDYFELEN